MYRRRWLHWEQALRIKPDSAGVHYDMGRAFEEEGKLKEAVEQYELALKFQPGMVDAQNQLMRLQSAPFSQVLSLGPCADPVSCGARLPRRCRDVCRVTGNNRRERCRRRASHVPGRRPAVIASPARWLCGRRRNAGSAGCGGRPVRVRARCPARRNHGRPRRRARPAPCQWSRMRFRR